MSMDNDRHSGSGTDVLSKKIVSDCTTVHNLQGESPRRLTICPAPDGAEGISDLTRSPSVAQICSTARAAVLVKR